MVTKEYNLATEPMTSIASIWSMTSSQGSKAFARERGLPGAVDVNSAFHVA